MPFTPITVPICTGSMTTTSVEGVYSLNCSAAWGQTSGILLDVSYSTQLELMLNQSGVDWNAVSIGFGCSMALFLLGVKAGAYFKLIKRVR